VIDERVKKGEREAVRQGDVRNRTNTSSDGDGMREGRAMKEREPRLTRERRGHAE